VELVGSVTRVGNTSMDVQVDIYVEEMYSYSRHKAITGSFTMVAVNDFKKPVSILPTTDFD
jgi:acyl-CoA hydrolase